MSASVSMRSEFELSAFALSREEKGRTSSAGLKQDGSSRRERPFSDQDRRIQEAIEQNQSSPLVTYLDHRVEQAMQQEHVMFSYPVVDKMVSGTLLQFCQFFFSSFPSSSHRQINVHLMEKVIECTFCRRDLKVSQSFIQEFFPTVSQRVQDYASRQLGEISRQRARVEWSPKAVSLSALTEQEARVNGYLDSIPKILASFRRNLPAASVEFLKTVLAITDLSRQKELFHARALATSSTNKEEITHACALGKIYFERSRKEKDPWFAIQTAGLYNYALSAAGKNANKYGLFHRLHDAGKQLHVLADVPSKSPYYSLKAFHAQMCTNRTKLKKCEQDAETLIKDLSSSVSARQVRAVCRQISNSVKDFARRLIDQCICLLGPPPCDYAVIGLGSLAREETTPQSDIELAILLEEKKNLPYFRGLAFLLHFSVVNLGRTILPCFNISSLRKVGFYDSRTRRGFSFDGEGGGVDERGVATKGCKTPFGNRVTFHLIQTPEEMAVFQGKNRKGRFWIEEEPHLPMELTTTTLVAGAPALFARYQSALQTQLGKRYKRETMRSYLATRHLYEGDRARFSPKLYEREEHGKLLEVKVDLYRLPHLLVDRLALFFGLDSRNTIDRVLEMRKKKILSPMGAHNLQTLVARTTQMRLTVYQFHKKQKGVVNAIADQFGFRQVQGQFVFDERNRSGLEEIYKILVPFQRILDRFFRRELKALDQSFYDNSLLMNGDIASRMLNYSKAEEYYRRALKEKPKDLDALFALGVTLYELGQKEAVIHLEKLFELNPSAGVLNTLALAYEMAGERKKAVSILSRELKRSSADSELREMILNNLSSLYDPAEKIEKAVPLLQEALQICTKRCGKKHPSYGLTLSNLAFAYTEGGQSARARSLFEQVLILNKELYGQEHPRVAIALGHVAYAYQEEGNAPTAYPLFVQAEKMTRAVFGSAHPMCAVTVNNLGCFYQKEGRIAEAIPFLESALNITETAFGSNHPKVSLRLSNLAVACVANHKIGKAIDLFLRALKLVREGTTREITCLINLGSAYAEQGNYKKAAAYFNKALGNGMSSSHPLHDTAVSNLSVAYRNLGQFDQALTLCEQVWKNVQNGPKNSRWVHCLHNLGNAHEENKRTTGLVYLEQALTVAEEIYKNRPHPLAITCLNNLGLAYLEGGKRNKALPLLQRSLKMSESLFGPDHPEIIAPLENLASAYKESPMFSKARGYYDRAMKIVLGAYGKGSRQHAKALNDQAVIIKESQGVKHSIPLAEEAHEYVKGEHFSDTPLHISVCHNLGSMYRESTRYEKAEPLLIQAVSLADNFYGKDHLELAVFLNSLGLFYMNLGRLTHARTQLDRAHALFKKSDLRIHYSVFGAVLHNLASVYIELKEYSKARVLSEESVQQIERRYGKKDPKLATNLNQLAHACIYLRDAKRARRALDRVAAICKDSPSALGEVEMNRGYGRLLELQGKPVRETLPFFLEAVRLAETIEAEGRVALCESLRQLGRAQMQSRRFKEAQKTFRRALRVSKELYLNQPHPQIGRCWADLGRLYQLEWSLGNAVACFKKALAIFKNACGENHQETLVSVRNLLKVEQEKSGPFFDLAPLEELARRLVESLGPDDPVVAECWNNLGDECRNRGQISRCFSFFHSAQKIINQLPKPLDPDVSKLEQAILMNLGVVCGDIQNFVEAVPLLRQAVTLAERVYGEDHEMTARSYSNLGLVLHQKIDSAVAITYLEKARLVYLKHKHRTGKHHSGFVNCLRLLGQVYFDQKSREKALSTSNELVAMVTECFGQGDPRAVYWKSEQKQFEAMVRARNG